MAVPAHRVVVKPEAVVEGAKSVASRVERVSSCESVKSAAMDIEFELDLAKPCGEDAIFAECAAGQDSPASEIGEFELHYLHNLYQPPELGNSVDSILTDNVVSSVPVAIQYKSRSEHSDPSLSKTSLVDVVSKPISECPFTILKVKDEITSGTQRQVSSQAIKLVGLKVNDISVRNQLACNTISTIKPSRSANKKQKNCDQPQVSRSAKSQKTSSDSCSNDSPAERASSCPPNSTVTEAFDVQETDELLALLSKDPGMLTPEEQKLIKKQRRLLKNRESAQLSRHRKKLHLSALERQVDVLRKEKAALATRVQELHDENERLRHQILSSV